MNEIVLSIIIPSYKDPFLFPTIDSLLENSGLGDKLEIIVVLDGYTPEKPIRDDKRIKIISLGANVGMRDAINIGVRASRGKYIARVDEHQMFGKNYDVILTRDCGKNEIVTARRYFLDVVQWKVMDIPCVDYCDLRICGKGDDRKFSGVTNEKTAEERKDIMIDDTFAMQGSFWLMLRETWDNVVKELNTELYGNLIFDSHEMVFQLWQAGGKLRCNKNTWHAHKERSFKRTHNNGSPENPAHCTDGYKKSLEIWEKYYWQLINEKKINHYE